MFVVTRYKVIIRSVGLCVPLCSVSANNLQKNEAIIVVLNKLFMIYLGGSASNANLELHDIQFVIAPCIEDTYERLINRWFGNTKGLHLDSYKHITGADGYEISIEAQPQQTDLKLYFVNLGGYDKNKMAEIHEFGLFVAFSPDEAKRKAKRQLLKNRYTVHKDNLMEVDSCLELSLFDQQYIHLRKSNVSYDLKPDWYGYHVIA